MVAGLPRLGNSRDAGHGLNFRATAFGNGNEQDSCRLVSGGYPLIPAPLPEGGGVKWCFFLFLHHLGPFCPVLYLGWVI